jgi:gas vesicle protein
MQDVYGRTQADESKAGTFLFGLVCGAAVGAAVGLMLAPKTGAEIRQQVLEQAEKLRKQAANAYGSASNAFDNVVARGREAVDVGREAYENTRPNGSNGAARDVTGA